MSKPASPASPAPDNSQTVLRLEEIYKIYPGTVALHKVNLAVHQGEVHGIIGKNGAGKSTLVGIIAGMIEPTCGTIHLGSVKFASYNNIINIFYHSAIMSLLVLGQGLVLISGNLDLSGLLAAGRQDSVSNSMGEGMVMLAFAGAILGGASLDGGKGTPLGMLGGALLLGMISNSLNLLGVGVTLVYATPGALIFLAIMLDRYKVRLRARLLHREKVRELLREDTALPSAGA